MFDSYACFFFFFYITGIDVEAAKNEEERKMVEDANTMLNSRNYKDRRHPTTGATPLHVAAAKGYIKCMT